MNPLITNTSVTTLLLSQHELNWDLVSAISEDSQRAGVPSSYRTEAQEILRRPNLMTGTSCLVVPLPGIASAEVPPTRELPSAIILRERDDGKGDAYLQLRGEKVCVQIHELGASPAISRFLVLYLFSDRYMLDIIPATDELKEEIWAREMSAQSRHFHDEESPEASAQDAFDFPIIVRRARTVSAVQPSDDSRS
jgi:hypothetical protein